MENNTPVPYIAYESTMARMERANKRSFIIIIILIIALIATNAGWVIYESQFETAEAIHTMMTTHTHETEAECPAVTVWEDTAEQAVI